MDAWHHQTECAGEYELAVRMGNQVCAGDLWGGTLSQYRTSMGGIRIRSRWTGCGWVDML